MWNCRSIKSLVSLTAMAASLACGVPAQAESQYPQRPVTIVVAFAPGGATDVLARKLAQKLGDHYKQSFVVENKPGAGGNIGTAYAGRAKPDGYTLYLGTVASHGVAPNLYKHTGYDPIKDFTPIGLIAASPQIIVVNKDSPIRSIGDLVQHGKTDNATYASSGAGTTIHLAGEMFNIKAGTKMEHVPFSGSGPAVNALLGGHVDVMFDDMPSSAPHVKAGSLRALAVTGTQRSALFPELPTLSEVGKPYGLEGFDVSAWFFLGAPAGIPDGIADSLNKTLNSILVEDDMKNYAAERGAQTLPGTRQQASQFIAGELKKWDEIITAGNIPKL
ncbi:tripartite tricarboxylate transporter substrate binding protein [Bordetella sp. BOR01]|uniref:Bug family tripartite tricarboxylate transporter substrate binding protein n=1 Tax=Bordetella sp. BOR01 TaxID=2854779 RepID=UPI001C454D76|nr:tripartite tricarboxylate transporter substrate binding protein [Bordetella sp. BOR01]MBV7481710.1 tripartite tricarboxylate transporter substrate binding protein [Bordetella sp. BOR01]